MSKFRISCLTHSETLLDITQGWTRDVWFAAFLLTRQSRFAPHDLALVLALALQGSVRLAVFTVKGRVWF